jgi:exopolyphosphatase/guanosine-5'-triphosphate,3'-diphosphate pyrophosphatase
MERYCAGDIGTNAIKIRITELDESYARTLFDARYSIRLGTSVFAKGEFLPADIDACVEAFREVAAACRSYQVEKIRIVATSAAREAANGDMLTKTVEEQTGCRIEIISGNEEARLLSLGLKQDLVPGRHNLIMDIGGGSTEFIYILEDGSIDLVHTVRVGAVRLRELVKLSNPVTRKQFRLLESTVKETLENRHLPVIAKNAQIVGVAGTIKAILDIKNRGGASDKCFTRDDVAKIINEIKNLSYAEMESRHGVEPKRAEVLLPGAMILQGMMNLYNVDQMSVSARGLRDGILEEMAALEGRSALPPVYEFSLMVGEKYNFDRRHAIHVASLATSLFDKLQDVHQLEARYRPLLEYAALLHDIGQFISCSKHHKHSYYLILNEDMPALTDFQRQFIASVARYHRKALPDVKHAELQAISPDQRQQMMKCAALLRVADAFDRQHCQLVDELVDVVVSVNEVQLLVLAHGAIDQELAAVIKKSSLFEQVFNRKLWVREVAPVSVNVQPK